MMTRICCRHDSVHAQSATASWAGRSGMDTENPSPLPVGLGSPGGGAPPASGPAAAAAHAVLAAFISKVAPRLPGLAHLPPSVAAGAMLPLCS